MAGGFSITGKGPRVRANVGLPPKIKNYNRDKSLVLRAPRLKAISVRDYSKPELASENPLAFSGAGFGNTGLD